MALRSKLFRPGRRVDGGRRAPEGGNLSRSDRPQGLSLGALNGEECLKRIKEAREDVSSTPRISWLCGRKKESPPPQVARHQSLFTRSGTILRYPTLAAALLVGMTISWSSITVGRIHVRDWAGFEMDRHRTPINDPTVSWCGLVLKSRWILYKKIPSRVRGEERAARGIPVFTGSGS